MDVRREQPLKGQIRRDFMLRGVLATVLIFMRARI